MVPVPPRPHPPSSPTDCLAAILLAGRDLLVLLDASGRVIVANEAFASALGTTTEELTGRSLESLGGPADMVGKMVQALSRVVDHGEPSVFEAVVPTPLGPRYIEYVVNGCQVGALAAPGALVVGRDVTTRRQHVSLLREREEFFSQIFQKGPLGVAIVSSNLRLLRVNARLAEMLGYEEGELVGRLADEFTHPEDVSADLELARRLFAGEISHYHLEKRYVRKSGEPLWIALTRSLIRDERGDPLYLLTMLEDIDERKRAQAERAVLEERVREAQRVESLGVLAGGIAHDFNNLLVPILGNAELLARDLPASSPAQGYLRDIVAAAERAAAISRQMLAYSGKGRFVLEPVELSSLVQRLSPLLQSSVRGAQVLRLELAPPLPSIEADQRELRQAALNLLANAAEASPEPGSVIIVRTGSRWVGRDVLDRAYLAADLPMGEYVFLAVTDTGPGMDEHTRARVFDPFFSSRGPGRGLGLPAVLGVVRGHGGAVLVESEPGQGTCVTLLFPPMHAGALHRRQSEAAPAAHTWRGHGLVLLVEDESALRQLTARTLERMGFQVIGVTRGAAALDVFARYGHELRAAIVDLMVSQVAGEEVCRRIRSARPDLRILALSGGHVGATSDQDDPHVDAVLQKPFTLQALRDALRKMLG